MHDTTLDGLAATLAELRASVAAAADLGVAGWAPMIERPAFTPSAHNLAAYLALRRRDLRPLQVELMSLGLSSLGRLEGRVMANLDAVAWAVDRLRGQDGKPPVGHERFFGGQATLARNTAIVFGPRPAPRRVRIVVTLPSQAADDPALAFALAVAGADVCRINCAHDSPAAWARMAAHVREASTQLGNPMRILMDLAGPKVRTGAVRHPPDQARLRQGDSILLHRPGVDPASELRHRHAGARGPRSPRTRPPRLHR
jgi:pyruvate kinase